MSIAEKIKQLQARLRQAEGARNDLVAKSVEEDRSLTDDEVTKYNEFGAELDSGAKELDRLLVVEKSIAAQAVAVTKTAPAAAGTATVTSNAPKGSLFTRKAMLDIKAKGNPMLADQWAREYYPDDHGLHQVTKAAIAPAQIGVAANAGVLVYPQEYTGDFIELLYPMTVLGRLGLRKIPFNVRIAGMASGTSVGWVGEGAPKPVTGATFSAVTLGRAKVGAIAAFTDEIIRFANPAVEAMVQADLLKATAQGLDVTFLGNGAGVADITPAGIFNGVAGSAASGSDINAVILDIQTLVGPFIAANYDLSSAKLLMNPSRALAIGSMRNALGAPAFPNIGLNGGNLEGLAVMVSNNIATDVIKLVIEDEIYLSEDSAPTLAFSTEASIILDSAPGTATSTPVSMFQNGMVAMRIEQMINWSKRRALASGMITGVAYGSTTPTAGD